MEDALARRILSFALDYYEKQWPFGKPKAEVAFTLVSSKEELEEVWRTYYGFGRDKHLPGFDGLFLTPHGRTDTLSIILCVLDKHLSGIKQLVLEMDHGSLMDAPGVDMEQRGIALMGSFMFLETIFHEYTHLCQYESFMEATNWTKGALLDDPTLYLHDEFLGRYVGMRTALRVMKPYMEINLFVSLSTLYTQDDMKKMDKEREQAHSFLEAQKNQLKLMASFSGMSWDQFLKGVEEELGHPVSPKGLSDLDMAQYMAFGPMKAVGERYRLISKNSFASRSGTQFLGTVRAFYEGGLSMAYGKEEVLPREELLLQNVYQIPADEAFLAEDAIYFLEETKKLVNVMVEE